MRHKLAGIVFVCFGAVLILSALLLFLYTSVTDSVLARENRMIYEELTRIAAEMQTGTEVQGNSEVILQGYPESSEITQSPETDTTVTNDILTVEYTPMAVVRIGDFDYIGYLDIPALALFLPVLADSNDESLKAAPCRQFGTPETDDFVIAGHNYRRHFANLYKLKNGDTVRFTDMDGDSVVYDVAVVKVIDAVDVAAILESKYAMILYTCDYTGKNRIAVFCNRKNT